MSTRSLRAARSTRPRPPVDPCPDQGQPIRRFPAPTEHSEELAVANLQLARDMAQRMASATRMPWDDLFLVASMGLLKACRLYDPNRICPSTGRPYAISTLAVPFIRFAMAQYLRDKGHTSGVRFPDRWRDKAPTVRRLAADGLTPAAIAQATGLGLEDVEGVLTGQSAPQALDPDAMGFATRDPDPWDEAEACGELQAVLAVADAAHAALGWADRAMIEAAWNQEPTRFRRRLARLPHGQFMRQAGGIIRKGKVMPLEGQQDLAVEVPIHLGSTAPRRRISKPAEILQAAEQLGLFGPCLDLEGGKTAAEDMNVAGEAVNQPPNGRRQAAELPAPKARRGDRGSGSGCGLLGSAAGGGEAQAPAEGIG
jgi:DNA-directed RNA polymerase specialized sigma subunit